MKPPYPANSRSNVLGNRAHLAQHWTFSWVKRWKIEVEIDVPSRDRFQVQQRGIACGNNFLDRHKHHVKTAVPNGNVAVGGGHQCKCAQTQHTHGPVHLRLKRRVLIRKEAEAPLQANFTDENPPSKGDHWARRCRKASER